MVWSVKTDEMDDLNEESPNAMVSWVILYILEVPGLQRPADQVAW
jgi:hypothetical protein